MDHATRQTILALHDVKFSYDRAKGFIDRLSLSLKEKEFIGLLGPNGSGKSTILKLASGILTPSAGTIALWNKPLHSYANRDRAKLISYLPQLFDVRVPFTVRDIVSMGLYPYDILPSITIDEALEMVGLSGKADCLISNLSGGEIRRTFIAMTVLQGAGILLLDEPLSNLDIRYQIELMKLLRDLRETKGISVIMALHDINIALHCETVVLIREGRILGSGSPEEMVTTETIREVFGVSVEITGHTRKYVSIPYGDA